MRHLKADQLHIAAHKTVLYNTGMYQAPDGHIYRIADAHVHVYADEIAQRAAINVGDFYDHKPAIDNPCVATLLEEGARFGIDRYLICSVATKAEHVDNMNMFVAKQCQLHPELIGMATSHPEVEDLDLLIDVVEVMGLKGFKLHPDTQQFNIDDPRMYPLYREAAARGLSIMFHDYSSPERLMRALDAVPEMICHAAHFGCCRIWDKRPNALADYDIMYDMSSTLAWVSREDTLALIDQVGVDKVMWGTDFPMWKYEDELHMFFELGLSAEDNQKILYDNFVRFYNVQPIDQSASSGSAA